MKDYALKSGERYHTLDPNLVGGDHLWRYRYAASRLAGGDRQLFGADVFCGSGYGAALVARQTQASILAIDGSEESIAFAGSKIHAPNIIWAAKLFPFDLPDGCFDFVMSMESMEHVKNHEAFFWVLTKSLKRDGQLFISCPNENVMPYTGYKWHYRHFVPAEVRALARENGLEEVAAFSTVCCGFKDGKTAVFYPHQMGNDQPRDVEVGDTMFFEFRKH
ncbi:MULTISPECIES: methyltransferase domain-containing protein [Xanthomonas]|uniref:Methyltransferase domain-containing protein n=1 Tax=Xanthomonas dyei TaxID=743699 RepID=A0ABZ0DF29_9XANT|nr:methyltransferase domain-containing protein [Xanthomonas dyei]WOB28422.1 methyltransferase domain-containing protein [Xanthomonas dyei]WOB56043.1 methyltransferase domain-containing protein [Xanthomonas dyei]